MTEKRGEEMAKKVAVLEAAVRKLVHESVRNGYCLSSGCVRDERAWIDDVDEWFKEESR
jgi:hypothetical protein